MKKKLAALCLPALLLFAACSPETPSKTPSSPEQSEQTPPPVTEQTLSLAELAKDHADALNTFLAAALPRLTESADLLSATFDLGDPVLEEIDTLTLAYTCKMGRFDRLFTIKELSFSSALSVQEIAEGNTYATALYTASVETVYSFAYDGKYNAENTALAAELYQMLEQDPAKDPTLLLSKESVQGVIGGKIVDVDRYTLIAQTDGSVTEYTLQVKDGDTPQEAFAEELYNTYEETCFQPELPVTYLAPQTDEIVPIDTLGELLQEFRPRTEAFLKRNTTNAIIETLGHAFSSDLLKSVRYSIGNDDATGLSSIQIEFTLQNLLVEGGETYYRSTITFDPPVSVVDIARDADELNDAIQNAAIQNNVTFAYNAKDTQLRMQEVASKLNKMGVSITDDMQVMASFSQDGTCKIAIADDTGYTQYSFTASGTGSIAQTIANAENVFVEKEYVGNEYGQGGSETPGGDINLDEDAATIAENLKPLQEAVNQAAFSDYTMSNIRWDLGEPDQNGDYDSIIIAFVRTHKSKNYTAYTVTNVTFPYSISANDLVNNPSAIEQMASQIGYNNIKSDYSCVYNLTTLTTEENNLVDAVAEHLITDGFNADLDGTIRLYTEHGAHVGSEGEYNSFTVIFINDTGIREFNFRVPYYNNYPNYGLEIWTQYIIDGQAHVITSDSVDFSENQIVVDAIS